MCLEKRVSNIPTEWLVKIINKTAIKSDPNKGLKCICKMFSATPAFPKQNKILLSKMFNLHHSTVVPNFMWFGTRLCHLLRRKISQFFSWQRYFAICISRNLKATCIQTFSFHKSETNPSTKESWQAWKEPKNCILPFKVKDCFLSLSQSKVNNT